MTIAMHRFDRELARGMLAGEVEDIAKCRVMLAKGGYAAHRLHRSALRAAHLRWALSGDAVAMAGDLTLAAEAGVVALEGAVRPEASVTHGLGDQGETTVPYLGDASFAVAEVFVDTFYAARLLRAEEWLDRICGAPADAIVEGDHESPLFRTKLAICLRALWREGAALEETLWDAMRATEPDGLADDLIDEALGQAAPAIHLMTVLGEGDGVAFAEALAGYQQAHAVHYALAAHCQDFRG